MRPHRSIAIATSAVAFLPAVAAAQAQTIRVSVTESGGETASHCTHSTVSGDGDRIAFESVAADLVSGDTNGVMDVFVRTRSLGTTVRASVSSSGGQATAESLQPALSPDGRWLTFVSNANDLVAGDTNGVGSDVFVKDLTTGLTEIQSATAGGSVPPGDSRMPSISSFGRVVAFSTSAGLFGPDLPTFMQIAVRDRNTGLPTISCASRGPGGVYANMNCNEPAVSADGRLVVFSTSASNLVFDDTNGMSDIYIWDRALAGLRRLSSTIALGESNGDARMPSISSNGRWVAFTSTASNLVPGDTNGVADAFVFDRQTHVMTRISTTSGGAEGSGETTAARISTDGRWVGFVSAADDLVPLDAFVGPDAFLKDRATGAIELLSVSTSGAAADALTFGIAMDRDGRNSSFDSNAMLAIGDLDAARDVYVRDRGFNTATTVCAGDGTAAPCVCSNPGDIGHGCENYALTGGALLEAVGPPSVSEQSLTIAVSGCPHNVTVVLFQGTDVLGGGFGVPFGDGLRCLGGSLARIGRKVVSAAGAVEFGYGVPGDPPISVEGMVPAAGGRRYYQVIYRIAGSFCFAAPVNSTNALAIDWIP